MPSHRVPAAASAADWRAAGAAFGGVPTKKQTIFGYTPHLQIARFGLAAHWANTFRGLRARLYTKPTAHTLCAYLNRLLGTADWLRSGNCSDRSSYPNDRDTG